MNARPIAALLLALAVALARADESPRAEYVRRAAAVADKDAEALFKLGVWCEAKRLPDLADASFHKVLEADPEHAKAREKLGWKKVSGAWDRDPYRAMADGVRLPTPEAVAEALGASGGAGDRTDVLAFLLDRRVWSAAFRRIDERLGLRADAPEIALELRDLPSRGNQPAMGTGTMGHGVVYVDVEKFASLWRLLEEAWARIRAGARATIPPADLRSTVPHELTHVFQGRLGGPLWLIEGMASYVQQDTSVLYGLSVRLGVGRARLAALDQPMSEQDAYPRGWIFFEYLNAKHGKNAVHAFTKALIEDHVELEEAARRATGLEWAALVAAERDWGEEWLKKYGGR